MIRTDAFSAKNPGHWLRKCRAARWLDIRKSNFRGRRRGGFDYVIRIDAFSAKNPGHWLRNAEQRDGAKSVNTVTEVDVVVGWTT